MNRLQIFRNPVGSPQEAKKLSERKQSALAVIRQAYKEQPARNVLAVTPYYDVIGAWSPMRGRYCIVAMLTTTGQWVDMPYELLIDGKPPAREWIPVHRVPEENEVN